MLAPDPRVAVALQPEVAVLKSFGGEITACTARKQASADRPRKSTGERLDARSNVLTPAVHCRLHRVLNARMPSVAGHCTPSARLRPTVIGQGNRLRAFDCVLNSNRAAFRRHRIIDNSSGLRDLYGRRSLPLAPAYAFRMALSRTTNSLKWKECAMDPHETWLSLTRARRCTPPALFRACCSDRKSSLAGLV